MKTINSFPNEGEVPVTVSSGSEAKMRNNVDYRESTSISNPSNYVSNSGISIFHHLSEFAALVSLSFLFSVYFCLIMTLFIFLYNYFVWILV